MYKFVNEWVSAKAPSWPYVRVLRWPTDEPLKNTDENLKKLIKEYYKNKNFKEDLDYVMYFDNIM